MTDTDQPKWKNKSGEALDFAESYLQLNTKQRESFLAQMTVRQCNILRNCLYNLIMNSSINISQTDRKYLNKRIGIIKTLASKKVCATDKRDILVKKNLLIRRILRILLTYVQEEKAKIPKVKNTQE